MQRSLTSVVFISIALYCLGLGPRLADLRERVIQPDEVHWVLRADDLVQRLKARNYSVVTSNINHPGIPPALIMAASQIAGQKLAARSSGGAVDHSNYDPLLASRAGVTAAACLIFPLLFILARPIIGEAAAGLAAALLAIDPNYIYHSQMAHLDAVLAIFVLLTVFTYLRADWERSLRLKLLSGLFWGCALATKPTSAVVVIALVLFQFLRARGLIERRAPQWRFIGWSDAAAVGAAHLVLIGTYTKLWHTNSSYVWRVGIHSAAADFLYQGGMVLRDYWGLCAAAGLLAVVLLFSACSSASRAEKQWPIAAHVKLAAGVLCLLFSLWPLRPAIYENTLLYWLWAFGLSGETHRGYGYTWTPPPGGYFGLLVRELPLLTLIGAALSVLWLVDFFKRGRPADEERPAQLISYAMLLTLLWLALLGVSSKQNVRYILSCYPWIYICAAVGLTAAVRWALQRLGAKNQACAVGVLGVLFVIQSLSVLAWRPHYGLFRNSLSGGLAHAVAREEAVPPAGIREAVDFLRAKSAQHGNDLRVMLLGDEFTAKKTEMLFHKERKSKLHFIGASAIGNAEFVLVFPAFQRVWQSWRAEHPELEFKEVFSYSFRGAKLVRIYEVPLPDYSRPLEINIKRSPKHTGYHRRYGDGGPWTAVGIPGENKKGYLMHGQFFRFAPGTYSITFPLGLPFGSNFDLSSEPEKAVAKLEVSKKCARIVRRGELSAGAMSGITLSCSPDRYVRAHVRVYWWGTTPLAVGSPSAVEQPQP